MSLTLSQQYSIYKSYGLRPEVKSNRSYFYYKNTNKLIGFEYPEIMDDRTLKSGYIYIDRLSKLMTKEKLTQYKQKASHNSKEQKFPKGCISTFDLTEDELRYLIELNIKYLS